MGGFINSDHGNDNCGSPTVYSNLHIPCNIFRKVYIEITSMIFVCDANNGLQGGNRNARINEIIRYEYELMRQ